MESEERVFVVLCTFPSEEKARQIGTALVERQLVACVNLMPGVESIYRWEGKVCAEQEVLGILKTTAGRFEELRTALEELHPYEVPEVLALPVEAGSEQYLGWVRRMVKSGS
jgi:periplasmic divalent cation tolerance protein